MPKQGVCYSANEANVDSFPAPIQEFIGRLRNGELGQRYSSRYIGSLVADFHRTILRGGIFLYPPTVTHPDGKLRLMYEANPVAWIAEQAGGFATDSRQRILDIEPEEVHQRTPLIVGSQVEMEAFESLMKSEMAFTS